MLPGKKGSTGDEDGVLRIRLVLDLNIFLVCKYFQLCALFK